MIAEFTLILLIVLVFVSIAVLYYLKTLIGLMKTKKSNEVVAIDALSSSVRLLPIECSSVEPADIIFAPIEFDESKNSENLSVDLYPKIESLLRAVPSLASAATSSRQLFKLTFSPEVTKGLANGSYSLMQSGGRIKAVAVNGAGKIVEQGSISLDRVARTVSSIGAIWQIMAIVTAQKFLSDVNKRLAGIEDSLKGLEIWLDTQEQGRFLGSMKYLSEVATTSAKSPNATDFLIIKSQTEQIYHESLQSTAANRLRANSIVEELLSMNLKGNSNDSADKFRKLMDEYFVSVSYAIRFDIVSALSEYLSANIDRNSDQESSRIESIIKDAEEFIGKIREDAQKMKDKSSQISGRWYETVDKVNAKRNSLNTDMEQLLSSCESALFRIRSIYDETKKIGQFTQEIESSGLSLMIETDNRGKLISARSLPQKKVHLELIRKS